jgi:hypothetical protein
MSAGESPVGLLDQDEALMRAISRSFRPRSVEGSSVLEVRLDGHRGG